MIPLIKSFFYDASAFRRYVRTALFVVGELMRQGMIPTGVSGGGKYGIILQAVALFVGAGQMNPRPTQQPG